MERSAFRPNSYVPLPRQNGSSSFGGRDRRRAVRPRVEDPRWDDAATTTRGPGRGARIGSGPDRARERLASLVRMATVRRMDLEVAAGDDEIVRRGLRIDELPARRGHPDLVLVFVRAALGAVGEMGLPRVALLVVPR